MSKNTFTTMRIRLCRKRTGQGLRAVVHAGSMSLAFCIILPAVLLLFTEVLRFSREARADADLARHARMITDSALALYYRDLYKTFGLFGMKEEDAKKALDSDVLPNTGASLKLEMADELKESDVIKDGIARHMTWRAATSILVDAIDKLRALEKIGHEVNVTQLSDYFPSVLKQGYETIDPDLGVIDEEPEWKDEYEALMNTEIRDVYQKGLSYLAPIFIPSEAGAEHETLHVNPFDNSGLQKFGGLVDKMLFVAPEGVLDRLILSEYALSYFYNDVPYVMRHGIRRDDYTPDGRMISKFSDSRRYEAEEIATGLKGKKAKTAVLVFIGAIRFAIHFVEIITNETERASFKATATATAAAISAVSLGSVNIPPEAIEWLLMATTALTRGAIDSSALNKGKEVDLWPGKKKIELKFRYRDFLRILIVAQSPDKIAKRIAHTIDYVYPSRYYTTVCCVIHCDDRILRFDAGFLSRKPEQDEIVQ
jgi:hypothetical protein